MIRATAHAALEELRQVIGVLRDGDEGGAPEPPQPTLARIPELVEESRAAGMRVRCTIDVAAPDSGAGRARADGVPRRAGGADERPQARAGRRGRRDDRGRRARSSSRW